MSIIQNFNSKYLPVESSNRFRADFNTPPGQYGFQGSAAAVQLNTRQTVLELDKAFVYFIDRVSYSASIDEGVYLESIDQANRPEIRLFTKNRSVGVYPRAFPCVNYKDNLEWNFYFLSTVGDDELQATMQGDLDQVAATVGVPTIWAQLSLVIYQIEATPEIVRLIKSGKSLAGVLHG